MTINQLSMCGGDVAFYYFDHLFLYVIFGSVFSDRLRRCCGELLVAEPRVHVCRVMWKARSVRSANPTRSTWNNAIPRAVLNASVSASHDAVSSRSSGVIRYHNHRSSMGVAGGGVTGRNPS